MLTEWDFAEPAAEQNVPLKSNLIYDVFSYPKRRKFLLQPKKREGYNWTSIFKNRLKFYFHIEICSIDHRHCWAASRR